MSRSNNKPLSKASSHLVLVLLILFSFGSIRAFRSVVVGGAGRRPASTGMNVADRKTSSRPIEQNLKMTLDEERDGGLEYRNPVTEILSNFVKKEDDKTKPEATKVDPFQDIDFDAPKLQRKFPLETLAAILDAEIYNSEWFVTGRVNPIYFSDNFVFEDPDVKLEGIEAYARGVYKIFDQETSRAEVISTVVNATIPNTITCTWRLSGKANIGPGLTIKPYIVYTDFTIDENGLIVAQEDRFGLPPWDILLSSLFPFLIGKITAPPAPPVPPRQVQMPAKQGVGSSSFLDGVMKQFFGFQ